ncbi:MAG: SipW-dependent-type signal peptide-containing protein [Clostridia bacterium]|nr:SipW-dependent-type signal peptide-containing protein [Clostridia bacterium]
MNKKKLLVLAMTLSIVAILAIGGTLAYFTDTDSELNVFTHGNVEIEIDEIFPEDELMPGSATECALQKEVYVENTGDNDAWMWVEILIPAAIDVPGNASKNDLHFNYYDTYKDAEGNLVVCSSAVATANGYTGPEYVINELYLGSTKIDGTEFNRYLHYTENDTAKANGEKTAALLAQVYMDSRVKQCTEEGHDEGCLVLQSGKHYPENIWEIVVNAYGIQAAGIDSIEEAINTYYAENEPAIVPGL